jgi:ATP-dependent exoDNAse (exonuclease V) alpha subunit
MTVRTDGDREKTVAFDPREMWYFDHDYAITSHSSRGLTSERVLVNMDTEVHPELINRRFAYVFVLRVSYDVQIYIDNGASQVKRGAATHCPSS